MVDLISYPSLLFRHPALNKCVCGRKPHIVTGNYADETVMVVCGHCDKTSQSFTMGIYEQGATKAIRDWNENV